MKFFMSFIIIHLLCYKLQFTLASSNSCFDVICIPSDYCKLTKPPPKNETTNIMVEFQKIQILNIDESKSTITLKLAIVMGWLETRILISDNATEEDKRDIKWPNFKILPKEFVNHLWLPDADIPHVHRINTYKLINDFEGFGYSSSWGNEKQILIGYRIEVETVLFCKMNFEAYPMDENTCYFTLGSYAPLNQSAQIFKLFTKRSNGVEYDAPKQVAQLDFAIDVKEGLPKYMKRYSYGSFYHKTINGLYQRTGFEIRFQRKVSRYIYCYYIPSGILVFLSFVSYS